MAISVFVLEDNPVTAQDLSEILAESGMEVLKICYSAEDALLVLQDLEPDVLLVDIMLRGQMTGIEFTEKVLQTRAIPVVYLTASSDQKTVRRAIDTHPSSFLTKPFDEKDVTIAIELAFSKHLEQIRKSDVQNSTSGFLFVKSGNKFDKVSVVHINYLEADGSYCKVVTDDQEYLITGTLNNIHNQLSEKFIRIHRSFAVNVNSISGMDADHIFLREKSIPIGRRYKEEVRKVLHKLS